MKKAKLQVNRIVIDKFNFQLSNNVDSDNEAKADVNVSFSDKKNEEKFQPIIVELKMNYEDSGYKVETRVIGYFSINIEDLSSFIKDLDDSKEELKNSLLTPLLNKLRLYIGLFSEGENGVIKIPDLTINHSNNDIN